MESAGKNREANLRYITKHTLVSERIKREEITNLISFNNQINRTYIRIHKYLLIIDLVIKTLPWT